MEIIITVIPGDLVTNLSLFVLSYRPKTGIRFSASWWPGNEKNLFKASHTLLLSHAEINRILRENFLTCCPCSYYSSMFKCYPLKVSQI